jgi:hypothetical protein
MLDSVGTFNPASPIEIRGAAAVNSQTTWGSPFGNGGFNSPSLLGVAYSAPTSTMARHTLEDGPRATGRAAPATIASTLSAQDPRPAELRAQHRRRTATMPTRRICLFSS